MIVTARNTVSGGACGCSRGACSEATSASSVSGLAGSRVRAAGSGHRSKLCEHSKTLRFGSLNLGTSRRKEGEMVETLTRRRSTSAVYRRQLRWCGGLCKSQNRMFSSKDLRYKFFWTGNKEGKGGVGILLAECWVAHLMLFASLTKSSSWNYHE